MAPDRSAVELALDDFLAERVESAVERALGARPNSVPPLLLKFDHAGEVAGLSRTAIFEKVRTGELQAVDVPGVGRRIRTADLEAWVASLASK